MAFIKNILTVSAAKAFTASLPLLIIPIFSNIFSSYEFVFMASFMILYSIIQACEQSAGFALAKFFSDTNLIACLNLVLLFLVIILSSVMVIYAIYLFKYDHSYLGLNFSAYGELTFHCAILCLLFRILAFIPKGILVGSKQHLKVVSVDLFMLPFIFLGIFIFFNEINLDYYFVWLACSSLLTLVLYVLAAFRGINSLTKKAGEFRFQFQPMVFAATFLFIAIVTSSFGGLDRLFLSTRVPPHDFTIYTILVTMASVMLLFSSPVIQVLLPELKEIIAANKFEEIVNKFVAYISIIATSYYLFAIFFHVKIGVYIFGIDMQMDGYPLLLAVLLISMFLSSLSYPFHATQIASRDLNFALISPIFLLLTLGFVLNYVTYNDFVFVAITLAALNLVNLLGSIFYTFFILGKILKFRLLGQWGSHIAKAMLVVALFHFGLLLLQNQSFVYQCVVPIVCILLMLFLNYKTIRMLTTNYE